ncbi:hypothetical protein Jab_1c16770 [Janthinobacterium sp. HH01]|uniref:hypothetical protein n=1 Tax=Janthinobacterium sp. HH01 TaxID=1198452 RepID=UPI0002AEA08E|nr:hypothetical protein [Janthinobacterium sp. HH01]ELX13057.1 hypothetical protein Jab_1c16770 [Janthinobacterium sp. HH01]
MIKQRPRYLPGLLITGLLHIAIIYAFMQRQHMADTPRAHREEIQWLRPIARTAIEPPRQPQSKPQSKPQNKAALQPIATPPRQAITPPKPPDTPAAQPEPQPPAATLPDDPFAQAPASPRPQSASDIVNQAKLDVGKIDKELSASYRQRPPEPPPDSKQARLERGINAAHDAVPPKWYQGARMVELSTPDGENKTRTYKIITAVGAYCININPEGRKRYTLCPK